MKVQNKSKGLRSSRLLALLFAAVLALAGCGESEEDSITMPGVEGLALDLARSDIERAGYEDDLEIIGGGTFGVVDEANWEVCSQLPAAGEVIDAEPRLVVERDCGGDEEPEPTEEETEPAEETTTEEGESPTPAAEPEETVEEAPEETEAPEVEEEPVDEAPQGPTAEEVEAKYLEHLHNNFADSFSDLCDETYTHWACFYDGVEGDPVSFLQVNLTTDGGWSEADLSAMAETAAQHWFNFIGCDFPEINTIVVSVNGLDHNHHRSEFPSMCG